MNWSNALKQTRKKLVTAVALPLLVATGCQNYESRHDGVTPDAGNQLAVNEALMVSDPWKRNAYNTHSHSDGKRSADIVSKYKNQHHVEKEGAAGAVPLTLPIAPPSETN